MNPVIRDTIDREIRKKKTSLERMLLRCIRHAHANWKKNVISCSVKFAAHGSKSSINRLVRGKFFWNHESC